MPPKEQLYYLLRSFVAGKYDARTFYDAFFDVYNSSDKTEFTSIEASTFQELACAIERYSPYEEDLKAYPLFYRSAEDVANAVYLATNTLLE